jgi:hypothetical protein
MVWIVRVEPSEFACILRLNLMRLHGNICQACNGAGQCRSCDGTGRGLTAKCVVCLGTGQCEYCEGTGRAKNKTSRGNSNCPKCGSSLDGVHVIRYGQPFRCANCKTELQVPRYYLWVGGLIGFGISLFLCISLELRGAGLAVGWLVFLFPSLFTVGILQRMLSPPRLVVYRDENSLFS